ncbi:MAG TPA: BREX-1 system adenine-specific DNA-methyltransferase PglX [Syntrophales bacterium]|nr:BREX-1 system adenine-specific DNA-methyltransferase PglX [Syntrophales bacterium]
MNKNKLKAYAPSARRAFIQAATDRAHFWGLSDKGAEPIEEKGDVAIIGGRPFPRQVAGQRRKLEERIKREGFQQVMEAVAYTWFNRFLALRYMELHGYLEHGFRVLSNANGGTIPEILDHAAQVELPGLDRQKVMELKLDGGKDAELYRMLLVAQCHALHNAMPFLFEKIDDETELLLPDNLLHSDSLLRKLVVEIDEEDWQEVEIIGWLYQFYISERKDQVIGKVVKSEDIPAATQLFTPNWIVKYMVQNSLGRMWLATYPDSPLRQKMEYYIEPADQTDEVKAQLKAITPASLNPESLSFLDPANGSGHILVEAYDIFKEIYLERGYSSRDFPRLILEKNLYGLDIDDRAAQMAGFALLMKARNDDRRILQNGNVPRLNVMAIEGSEGLDAKEIAGNLLDRATPEVTNQDITELVELFRHGKTFGSLITVPEGLAEKLPALSEIVDAKSRSGDMFAQQAAEAIFPFVEQAKILARKYDCVVANPPYMGNKGMNPVLKEYAKDRFPDSKSDMCAMFIERGFELAKVDCGYNALVTMQSWLFLSSFEAMREKLLTNHTIITMAHLGARAFGEISGEVVQTTTFVLQNRHVNAFRPVFFRLIDGQEQQKEYALRSGQYRYETTAQDDFRRIAGRPIVYWASKRVLDIFESGTTLGKIGEVKRGMTTSDNNRFIRFWPEVSINKSFNKALDSKDAVRSGAKWFPYSKGGGYRKWFGMIDLFVNWEEDGRDVINFAKTVNKSFTRTIVNIPYYFRPSVGFSYITNGPFSMRWISPGCLYDSIGPGVFYKNDEWKFILACMNSKASEHLLKMLSPTIALQIADIIRLPVPSFTNNSLNGKWIPIVEELVAISRVDWDSFETSWDFRSFPWLTEPLKSAYLAKSWKNWETHTVVKIKRMQELETENNRIFIEAYGLQDELTPEVPEDQITLARADREADMKRLISYAIGCMMGRYSLDQPGLVYAHSGNEGFDESKYESFPADDDGIIPVTDMDWFPDDVAGRFEEFLKVAFAPSPQPSPARGEGALLEENLKFVAESLSPKAGKTPRETIRSYISTQFFKDHLQTYKKRPIYWLFSSGKQRAFECFVYLHRYNEATLSRMRNEYVTPLQGKLAARMDYLANEIDAASTTSARSKLQKQLEVLNKKQTELNAFDDLLRHYADQRISLDLDDGVKVNYGKFGNLLAEVKAIAGSDE